MEIITKEELLKLLNVEKCRIMQRILLGEVKYKEN